MRVEAVEHELLDESVVGGVLDAELAVEVGLRKDADVWILLEVHVVLL